MSPFEKKLLAVVRSLAPEQRPSLLEFAEFLASRTPKPVAIEINPIPRPAEESVVHALKRLSSTYPMLERDQLLHEATGQMSDHLMKGKPAGEVIDELELIFSRHYARFLEQRQ